MAHQRHHKTAEQQRLTGQTLDFLVGSAQAHRGAEVCLSPLGYFDSDLRGPGDKTFVLR